MASNGPVDELKGLLRETVEVSRDSIHAIDDSRAQGERVEAALKVLAEEKKRENDLKERQLQLEEQQRKDKVAAELAEAGARTKFQIALATAFERICAVLDSRWATIAAFGGWIVWVLASHYGVPIPAFPLLPISAPLSSSPSSTSASSEHTP